MGQARARGTLEQRIAASGTFQDYPECPHVFSQSWLHGTDSYFEAFAFPPPQKKGDELSVAHTGVFLTLHPDFAAAAGKGLCSTKLRSSAKVLDLTVRSKASEQLRKEVCKNELAAFGYFINDPETWLLGWQTGDVLRYAYNDARVEPLLGRQAKRIADAGVPDELVVTLLQHNLTRGLIEEICGAARRLGADAIYGHEVDRHAGPGQKIARPWLAVLNDGAVEGLEWIAMPETADAA